MTNDDERIYVRGRRSAWLTMLQTCLRELVDELHLEEPASARETAELVRAAVRVAEREQAVAVLRRICEDHGDNDWKDTLHLADVLEKHLERHLEAENGRR